MWSGYSEKGTGSQERGPGSFVFTPPGTAVQAGGGPNTRVVEVQAGVVGNRDPGNTAPAIRIPDSSSDRTLQALMKFGEDQIAPQLAKAKEARFIQGVQKAASGQAMSEIVNEQPWYTRIFGEGPVVEGAQAYTVQAKTEQWAQAQERNMGQLAQQSPEAVPAYLMESMNANLTGDPATDSLIKANMVKSVPSLIKQHTKAYYKGQQEKIAESQINAMLTAGQSIQVGAQADPDMLDPQDIANRKLNQLATWTPAAFQDQESYNRATKTVIQLHAEAGDFHALRNLRDSGVIGHMKAEDRMAVEQTINRFSTYHASQAANSYAARIAEIKVGADRTMSAEDVAKAYDAINLDYQSRSGNDQPIVSRAAYTGDMVHAARAARTAEEFAQRVSAKAAYDQANAIAEASDGVEKHSRIMQTAALGDAAQLTAMEFKGKNFKEGEVDRAIYSAFAGDAANKIAPMPAEQIMPLLARNATKGYVNPFIRNEIDGIVNSGLGPHVNDNFLKGFALFKAIKYEAPGVLRDGGLAGAAKYFNEAAATRFSKFEEELGGRGPEFNELAYQEARVARPKPGREFKKEELAAATSLLGSAPYNTSFMGLGGRKLTAEAQRVALSAMQDHADNSGSDQKLAALNQLEKAKAGGLEIVGSHAWRGQREDRRLDQYMQRSSTDTAFSPDQVGAALDATVAARLLAATGKDTADHHTLIRTGDRHGEAQFQLFATVDGKTSVLGFSSEDIRMQAAATHFQEVRKPKMLEAGREYNAQVMEATQYSADQKRRQERLVNLRAIRARNHAAGKNVSFGMDQEIDNLEKRLNLR